MSIYAEDVHLTLAEAFAVTDVMDVTACCAHCSLTRHSQGIDIYAVIEACSSQPYSHLYTPGIAVGGHGIPIYPQIYPRNDPAATIVRAARAANRSMPHYAVALLEEHHGPLAGQRVAVFGASYRGGVKETAFSGVFDVVAELEGASAIPMVNDPMYTRAELEALGFQDYEFGQPVDAVIVQANHAEYVRILPEHLPGARAIVDGRGMTSHQPRAAIPTHIIGSASASASA